MFRNPCGSHGFWTMVKRKHKIPPEKFYLFFKHGFHVNHGLTTMNFVVNNKIVKKSCSLWFLFFIHHGLQNKKKSKTVVQYTEHGF